MAYSTDLRNRVLKYIEEGGKKTEASRIYRVSLSAVYAWEKLRREKGCVERRPLNRKNRKIDAELLRRRVEENPDALLRDHAKFFGVRFQSISMALKRMKIKLKKRSHGIKSVMKKKEESFVLK